MKPGARRQPDRGDQPILGSDAEAPLKQSSHGGTSPGRSSILGSDAEAPLKPVRGRLERDPAVAILGSDAEAPLKREVPWGFVEGAIVRSSAAMPRPR